MFVTVVACSATVWSRRTSETRTFDFIILVATLSRCHEKHLNPLSQDCAVLNGIVNSLEFIDPAERISSFRVRFTRFCGILTHTAQNFFFIFIRFRRG
jgi:hypothetical protein